MGVVLFGILTPRPTHSTIKYENKIEPYVVAQNPVEIPHIKVVLPGKYVSGNCVEFIRSARPDTPQPLWTLEQKKKLITHGKDDVKTGDVAVTAEGGRSGHVALVIRVEKENILIRESGVTSGVSQRWIPITMPIGFF